VKRRDELVVGVTVLAALVLVVGGSLWLSRADFTRGTTTFAARFRTVGGLGVGDPVVLRGVRVGRVSQIRLGERNWVEAQFQIYGDVTLPAHPAIIAASASLFGEWQAGIIDFDQAPDDPNVRGALDEARAEGGDLWPGATLPDIGQLTAQAGRIATDIASVSSRIQQAFDSSAVSQLQDAIRRFGQVANQIAQFTEQQTTVLRGVGERLDEGSGVLSSWRASSRIPSPRRSKSTAPPPGSTSSWEPRGRTSRVWCG
jgi:ABC-type transporter Mla subunit MlaD